jgi:hypothetical protein
MAVRDTLREHPILRTILLAIAFISGIRCRCPRQNNGRLLAGHFTNCRFAFWGNDWPPALWRGKHHADGPPTS